ncbi:hypothetical protein ATCC90586_008022 [Pythium insidiosum]|nr:hypothetical protein ATCC90586_008022 [Pythium insidiosum]
MASRSKEAAAGAAGKAGDAGAASASVSAASATTTAASTASAAAVSVSAAESLATASVTASMASAASAPSSKSKSTNKSRGKPIVEVSDAGAPTQLSTAPTETPTSLGPAPKATDAASSSTVISDAAPTSAFAMESAAAAGAAAGSEAPTSRRSGNESPRAGMNGPSRASKTRCALCGTGGQEADLMTCRCCQCVFHARCANLPQVPEDGEFFCRWLCYSTYRKRQTDVIASRPADDFEKLARRVQSALTDAQQRQGSDSGAARERKRTLPVGAAPHGVNQVVGIGRSAIERDIGIGCIHVGDGAGRCDFGERLPAPTPPRPTLPRTHVSGSWIEESGSESGSCGEDHEHRHEHGINVLVGGSVVVVSGSTVTGEEMSEASSTVTGGSMHVSGGSKVDVAVAEEDSGSVETHGRLSKTATWSTMSESRSKEIGGSMILSGDSMVDAAVAEDYTINTHCHGDLDNGMPNMPPVFCQRYLEVA